MKGTKFIIAGLVLVGAGALAYFIVKKNGKGSKKDFIIKQYDKSGVLNANQKKSINDSLDKMSADEINIIYEFLKEVADQVTPNKDLSDKAYKISEKYGLPV